MKKITALALLIALLCGVALSEGEITVADVASANDGRLLVMQYGSIGVNTIYYSEDGAEELSFFTYAKADKNGDIMYVYEDNDGSVEIMKNSSCAGFDASENQLFTMGYVLGEYEASLDLNLESLIPRPSEDSTRTFVTALEDSLIFTEEIAYGETEATIIEYTLDPETLLVREAVEYYRDADGTVFKVLRAFLRVGEDYEINEELEKLFKPAETRKVTVIADLGNGETRVFEFAPPADTLFMLMYPFEYIGYSDPEMTAIFDDSTAQDGNTFPAETTLYLGRFE